jgi:hypothetical protein
MTIPAQVAEVFAPSDSDWVITIAYRDGVVRSRRINPGRITEEQAVNFALAADRRTVHEIASVQARRASDVAVVATGADGFLERMRRLNG